MVDEATMRRLALALPGAEAGTGVNGLTFTVGGKGFAWSYLERVAPKAPRRPRLDVLAVVCALERKELLIEAAPDIFFDDDHYRGYPAVLVRLTAVDPAELAALLHEGWRRKAPKRLLKTLGPDA